MHLPPSITINEDDFFSVIYPDFSVGQSRSLTGTESIATFEMCFGNVMEYRTWKGNTCSVFCVVMYLRIFGKTKLNSGLFFLLKCLKSISLKLFIFRI